MFPVYTKITSKPVPIEEGNDEEKAHNCPDSDPDGLSMSGNEVVI